MILAVLCFDLVLAQHCSGQCFLLPLNLTVMTQKKIMPKMIFISCLAILIAGCGNSVEDDKCVARGVEYFKEMGSYPNLTSAPDAGRKAEDVARERCGRTVTAF